MVAMLIMNEEATMITSDMGWQNYVAIKNLEQLASDAGLRIKGPGQFSHGNDFIQLCVPEEPHSYGVLPVFTRGTVLKQGTVKDLTAWLEGWLHHGRYVKALGVGKALTKAEDRHAGQVIARKMGMIQEEAKDKDDIPF